MAKAALATSSRKRNAAGEPLYMRIVRVLQKEIVKGKHPVGARLPT